MKKCPYPKCRHDKPELTMTNNGVAVTCPNCYASGPYILTDPNDSEKAIRAALDQWDYRESVQEKIAAALFGFIVGGSLVNLLYYLSGMTVFN